MPRVVVPEVLKRVAKLDAQAFEAEGLTVGDVVRQLCRDRPALEPHLLHPNRAVKEHFVLSVGGVHARDDSPVNPGDLIELLLATSGGSSVGVGSPALTPHELGRYARHLGLPQVGRDGQLKLKASRVLVIGAGGLGSPVCLYLAAAGVGTIGVVDGDVVEESNLQRQILHGAGSVGVPKVESARRRLADLNGLVDVQSHACRLTGENAPRLLEGYDVVVDGTDNFESRYVLNEASVEAGIPYVYGSIGAFHGQASVFNHAGGPCYQCLYPEMPPQDLVSTSHPGVLGVVPGIVGAIQAAEAMKLVLGIGAALAGRLLRIDALNMTFGEVLIRRDSRCRVCAEPGWQGRSRDVRSAPGRGVGSLVELKA
jgi:sulfur-carrier protein adenylyltransferase/sulfurtransferase